MDIKQLSAKFGLYKNYFVELITLSIPIMMGNVGNVLIGAGDVIVAGRHSTETLAAISISNAIFMTFLIAGMGFLSSISPVVANLRGGRKPARNLFRVTLKYALVMSGIVFCLIWGVIQLVPLINLADNLTPMIVEYMKITSFSIFGVFVFVAIKEFLQAFEIVVFPNSLSIIAIFVNLALNIIFVFGFWKIPSMGVAGLAVATLITRTLQGVVLLAYALPFLKRKTAQTVNYLKDLIKVGWPISLALFSEFLGFNITAVIVGKFSALFAATHNVIISMTSITYMVPLSIANAMSIKVGFANGEKNFKDIVRYTACGTAIIFLFTSLMFVMYLKFPVQLIEIFTNDPKVLLAGLPVIFVVVCFLFFDNVQCAIFGALKGLKKTKAIMFTLMLAYYGFCIPIGCTLAYKYNIVLLGFWVGLAVALFVASIIATIILVVTLRQKSRELADHAKVM